MGKCIALLFVCFTTMNCFAQKTGLIHGAGYDYSLKVPKGWVMDDKAGRQQKIATVFYPKNDTWDSAVTVIYTTTWKTKPYETADAIIKADLQRFRNAKPGLSIELKPNISLTNGIVYIRDVLGDKDGNYEEVAYIKQKNYVVLIVLSSRNKEGFEKNKALFHALVRSFIPGKQ